MKKTLLSVALGLISVISFGQLNGTYTINSGAATSGTNFQTFSAAVSALGANGVSGAVTFNVTQGTYSESVTFPTSISGTSSTNNITFQSAASNTSNPVITSSSYVINMQNGSLNNITFRELDLVGTSTYCVRLYPYYSTSYSYTDINFEDCLIQVPTYSSGQYPVYMYGYYGGQMKVSFDGCQIDGGYYSVYGYCYYGATGSELTFNECEFSNFYYMSGYLYGYQAYPKVTFTNNYVHDSGANSSVYGLYCYYSGAGTNISGNRFELSPTNYGYGVLAYYAQGTSTDPVMVTNNSITYLSQPAYSQYGLRMGYGYYNKIFHNTTNITNNYAGSYGAYMYFTYSGAGNEYKNNIVSTAGTSSYSIYLYNGGSYLDMADNVYYANSGNNVNIYAAGLGSYSTVPAWQTASSSDPGAVCEDPSFTSATNLTPQAVAVNDIAEPVGVLQDIDGLARSLTTPDPGCYEFSVPTNNAGIDELIAPDAPLCSDDTSVVAVLKNTGLVPLTSCTITYELNGTIQTNFVYSGSLAVGDDTTLTILGSTSFSSGDEIRVWSSMPNGVVDSNAAYDTVSVQIFSGLTGTYNIPNDYATLTDAAADVMLKGLCGHVVMEINSGTYNEQFTLGEILGADQDATLTWTSSSGNASDVKIQYSTTANVVQLSGSDWVTFQDLTIHNNTTSTNGIALRLDGGAEHITVDHCILKTGTYPTTSSNLSPLYSVGNNHNLTVTNSEILYGGYGLFLQGSGNTSRQENIVINNNIIKNAYYLQTYIYYIDGFEFNNNVVTNDTNIYVSPYGLYLYYVDNFNVTGNYIGTDAEYNSAYGGYSYGVYLYQCIGSNNPRSSFSNNCINVGKEGSTSYGYYGIYSYYSGLYNFHNNSVTRRGGNNGYYTSQFNAGGLVSVKNNSFADYNNGYARYADGFTVSESENNNFYSNGGTLVYHGSSAYSNLEDYQNGTGFDADGISTDPAWVDTLACVTCNDTMDNAGTNSGVAMYDIDSNMRSMNTPDIGAVEWVSPASFTLGGDSTYCADEVTIEAGPAQSVTWSVNGNSSTAPTLTLTGGNEATTYNVLVSIQTEYCGSASDNALITLVPNANLDSMLHICADENATLDPGGLSSGSYTWSTGAMTQTIVIDEPGTYTVTKDVMGCVSSATTAVTQSEAVEIIGTEVCSDDLPLTLDATIANGTTYAWSGGAAPTNAVNTFNDAGAYTVSATDSYGCSSVDSFEVVVLEAPEAVITTPSYSGFIYVFDASSSPYLTSSSTVNWNFGAGASPATSTNVMETVVYPWSSPANPASYSVSLEINNGCGVDIATKVVAPTLTGVDDLAAGEFAIFPNPANDVVTIATKDVDAGSILILDMSGRTVAQAVMSAGSNNHEINVSGLAAGAYIVKVATDANAQMKQLIVQ